MVIDIQKKIEEMVQSPFHNGISISMYDEELGEETHFSGGALTERKPYFSTAQTKLFVTTVLVQLLQEGKIDFDAPFRKYMPDCRNCVEVHVKDGVDYTEQITIKHLMSNTSGLGDYYVFERGRGASRKMLKKPGTYQDKPWGFEDIMRRARNHGGSYAPGQGKYASYANANFHILGRVIERIENDDLASVFVKRITGPLGLGATYLYADPSDKRPLDFMHDDLEVHIPQIMASQHSEAGLVTTSRESLTFLRAFFEGYLFDKSVLPSLYKWVPNGFPAWAGIGIERIKVPWFLAVPYRFPKQMSRLFKPAADCHGHVGLGGSFVLRYLGDNIYVAGTVNQLSDTKISGIFTGECKEAMHYKRQQKLAQNYRPAQRRPLGN